MYLVEGEEITTILYTSQIKWAGAQTEIRQSGFWGALLTSTVWVKLYSCVMTSWAQKQLWADSKHNTLKHQWGCKQPMNTYFTWLILAELKCKMYSSVLPTPVKCRIEFKYVPASLPPIKYQWIQMKHYTWQAIWHLQYISTPLLVISSLLMENRVSYSQQCITCYKLCLSCLCVGL